MKDGVVSDPKRLPQGGFPGRVRRACTPAGWARIASATQVTAVVKARHCCESAAETMIEAEDDDARRADGLSGRPAPVRVVTVDDQAVFRRRIRAVIEETPGFEQVGDAASGEECLALTTRLHPDLALVDVRMPGLGGFETARLITAAHPEIVVLLVSVIAYPPATIRAASAAAFVPKERLGPSLLHVLWEKHGRQI